MKQVLLYFLLTLSIYTNSQNYDCRSDFFSINSNMEIQLWSLSGNTVSGGSVILIGQGAPSLSYHGDSVPTFHTPPVSGSGILSYQNTSWVSSPSPYRIVNNGGYGKHHFMYATFHYGYIDTTRVTYTDGSQFRIIPIPNRGPGLADIPVDNNGRAWIFTESGNGELDSVFVIDSIGIIAGYSVSPPIPEAGSYGSFFLNDKLFVGYSSGIYQDSLCPFSLISGALTMENRIPFDATNLKDLASCQDNLGENLTTNSKEFNSSFSIYPNPGNDQIQVESSGNIDKIEIYNSDGKKIGIYSSTTIDISLFELGIYYLKIESSNRFIYRKFVKK